MNSEMNYPWLIIYFVQISLFQFYAAPKLSLLTWKLLEKRNPELAMAHLGLRKTLHDPRWDYIIGAFAVTMLVSGFASSNLILYWSGKYLSLFGFLFTILVIDLIQFEKLKKLLPLKKKRSATLVPRTFGRIVPLWAWALCLIATSIFVIMEKDTMKQVVTGSAVLVCVGAAILTEKKSKISEDLEEDQLYRKSEMWTIFIIACTFPLFNPLSAYFSRYGIDAVFSSVPLIAFVWFLNSKVYKRIVS